MSAIVIQPGEGKSVMHGPSGGGTVFKLYSADTGGAFALVEHRLEPGVLAPPHLHHNEDEYSYVLEGEITLQIGEQIIHAPTGTLVSKPRGVFHAVWNSGVTLAKVLEMVSPAGLEEFFQEAGEAMLAGTTPERHMALMPKHNLEIDMSRALELAKKYNLKMPGMLGQRKS